MYRQISPTALTNTLRFSLNFVQASAVYVLLAHDPPTSFFSAYQMQENEQSVKFLLASLLHSEEPFSKLNLHKKSHMHTPEECTSDKFYLYTNDESSSVTYVSMQGSHRNSKTQFRDFYTINNVISMTI